VQIASRFTVRPSWFLSSSPPLIAVSLLLAGALVTGCGGDAGRRVGVAIDGGDDGDSGLEGGLPDAGVDAGPIGFVLHGPCVAADGDVQTFVPRESIAQPAPSLIGNGNNFDLTFAEQSGCADSVVIERMASSASVAQTREALDECATVRNAVGVPVGGAWLVAWLDSRSGGLQVFATVMTKALPPQVPPLPPPPPVNRVAFTASPDTKGSLALVTLPGDTDVLLAWSETDPTGMNGRIKLIALHAADASPNSGVIIVREDVGQLYGSLAMAPIPTGGAVLGYVAGSGNVRSIFLQRLDATGASVGDPTLLSPDGDQTATVSIAMKNELTDRGAAVYSVNPAGMRPGIRFNELDAVGQPVGQFRVLSGALEHAGGVGISVNVSGYAVAYRAVTDINWDVARMRVMFLSDVGNRAGNGVSDVAVASDFGGAPAIASTLDGRVAVSWFDDDEFGNRTLKLLSYPCNR
jgi:hypothetical protein